MSDKRAPATADAISRFPTIIPEPQHIEYFAGGVQKPGCADIASLDLPGDAEEAAKTLADTLDTVGYTLQWSVNDDFDRTEIPDDRLDEGYELTIDTHEASITSRTSDGLRWGVRTLVEILKRFPSSGSIPVATITDWPSLTTRGVFIEDKWGTDLMELDDFKDLIDYLAERKMNNLGIGLYGCWCVQYDGGITEWVNVPVPGHPEIKREWTIRWYSPSDGEEKEITYLPRIFEEDFFGEVVAYGQQKGVEVIPYVNSLGHNTLIPRLIPEFAAKDEDGNPEEFGYCLSNPDLVQFVKDWYQQIYETYLKPNDVHTFHIQLDEVGQKFCRCEKCSEKPMEQQFQDWAITLAKHLVSVGVENVVIYNDQFTRHMEAWDEAFVQRLADEGLIDHVIIDWWGYGNDDPHPDADPKHGYGVRSWVKPMTCYYAWSKWDPRQRNIEKMVLRAAGDRAEGAASYSVFDPAWGLEYDALAEYSWNMRGPGPIRNFERKWAQVRADGDTLEARRLLDRCAVTPAFGLLWYYTYTYNRPNKPWPREYPKEPLQELGDKLDQLQFLADAGKRVQSLLEGRTGPMSLGMAAEGARIESHGVAFLAMMEAWQAAHGTAEGYVDAQSIAQSVNEARTCVEKTMLVIENNKPHYWVPSCLRDMSVIWEYLGLLSGQLTEVAGGQREWNDIDWFIEANIAQRER
ncbi:MAG: glycoside hydrolase family 20 zincin-like fold domain-containing protein [Armatimonadota bacterium]